MVEPLSDTAPVPTPLALNLEFNKSGNSKMSPPVTVSYSYRIHFYNNLDSKNQKKKIVSTIMAIFFYKKVGSV
jgi:hypothetical protein